MNVVDSSGWLEYFSGGKNAGRFAAPLRDPDKLVVPSITIFEVFKVLLRESGQDAALQAVAAMQRGNVVELDTQLAMSAATASLQEGIPMADSIILATARMHQATIWTQDVDFKGIPNVKYFSKPK